MNFIVTQSWLNLTGILIKSVTKKRILLYGQKRLGSFSPTEDG